MYHQIADDIIKQISQKKYTEKLPSEAQLIEHYQVSRNTIRKAIDEVCQQGLLRRVKGSGYFINKITMNDAPVVNLSLGAGRAMREVDGHLASTVLTIDSVKADQFRADHLHVEVGATLIHVVRVRRLNGDPYCLESSYYVAQFVPEITEEDANNSIFKAINQRYGITVNNAENYLSVSNVKQHVDALPEIDLGQSYLTLTQVNYYANNVAFNFSTTQFFNQDMTFYFHSSQTFGGESK